VAAENGPLAIWDNRAKSPQEQGHVHVFVIQTFFIAFKCLRPGDKPSPRSGVPLVRELCAWRVLILNLSGAGLSSGE